MEPQEIMMPKRPRQKRTDVHRPGAIVPADYEYVFSYSMPTTEGGIPVPPWGINCELDRRKFVDGPDGRPTVVNGKHNADGRCCVIGLRQSGHQFAATGGPGKCSICGAAYVNGDVWKHITTGEHIHVGHNCADKYELLADRSAFELAHYRQKAATAVQIKKAKNDEERQAFLDANPGLELDLHVNHPIIKDIAAKFVTYRSLSDKQIAFVRKLANEVRNPTPKIEEKHIPAPEGRVTVRGIIVSTKAYESDWGTVIRMTVKVTTPEGVWLCWGTKPSSFLTEANRGAEVEFTATLKRGNEPHFAIFKRPTKASVITPAEVRT